MTGGDAGAYKLSMQGLAESNARLGATIRKLVENPHFRDIDLRNSTELLKSLPGGAEQGPGVVQFTIEATVSTEDGT
jgi:hypothetical protein